MYKFLLPGPLDLGGRGTIDIPGSVQSFDPIPARRENSLCPSNNYLTPPPPGFSDILTALVVDK